MISSMLLHVHAAAIPVVRIRTFYFLNGRDVRLIYFYFLVVHSLKLALCSNVLNFLIIYPCIHSRVVDMVSLFGRPATGTDPLVALARTPHSSTTRSSSLTH
jgi:hypothetical protein